MLYEVITIHILARLNEEIKRGNLVVHVFTDTDACLRLIPVPGGATHSTCLEDNRFLSMTFLTEQKKELLRPAV